ncbi:MAG: VWA domain-containing protein [Nanoarchaeota archaeon]|nr:VWA domain-containing protein [Nanoarchaeota archaeon]MBU1005550.1 VWA domain-containing protein [Nanoarchaeota archaeon]MBU1945330.1 VWA domain-containing protein [Nanoarchaeota archaeon]
MKGVSIGSLSDEEIELKEQSSAEELAGKLSKQDEENKLMNSVMENDEQTIDDGKTIKEALNQGIGAFTPDLMFEQLVKNYSIAKQIYGPSLIRQLTTYDENYLSRNIKIPEFQKELKKKLGENIERLKDENLIQKDGTISDKGIELASLILYTEELDNLIPKGILGEKLHKKAFVYGDKEDTKNYKKGDRYRDIAIKKSLKLAIRRGHAKLNEKDLKTFEKQSKGQICLIYALDASGSMKGKKIETCKKAGIALAYKAIEEKDKVGLIVFGSEIKEFIEPTTDFRRLLTEITKIKASKETNISDTIKKAIEIFPSKEITKHLLLLTDALPTVGEEPEKDTLEAVSLARSNGITISLIGIQLDEQGKELAEKITALAEGKLYIVKDLEEIDKIVLEDYYGVI